MEKKEYLYNPASLPKIAAIKKEKKMVATSIQARKFVVIERLIQLQNDELFLIIERLLMPEDEKSEASMTEIQFEKFLADRRRDISDLAERVPGEAVLEKLRARFVAQTA